MKGTCGTPPFFETLLTDLREAIPLDGYQLAIYCQHSKTSPHANDSWNSCCTFSDSFCGDQFTQHLTSIFEQIAADGRPTVFRCPTGLLGFAIELRQDPERLHYLVATGVREQCLDLFSIETVAKSGKTNPFDLLENLQKLPVTTEQEVQKLADRVYKLTMAKTSPPAPVPANTDTLDQLKLVAAISSSLDQATTMREVSTLLQETIGLMFDVPAIVTALPDRTDGQFTIDSSWGQAPASGLINPDLLARVFPSDSSCRIMLREDGLRELFPKTQARFATCQSLTYGDGLLGIICYLNKEFSPEEYLLVELLTGRAAQRLALLRQEQEFTRKSNLSSRFLSMITTLGGIQGQELYDHILQMASELTDASSGSLMLLDEGQELLQIRSSIGMNPHLMKAMSIRLGTGIAGNVALSGHPLLVNDIERDERIATPNRPRFKTKSFISLPLISKVRVSGVLNLSDKRNQGIFTHSDMELLTPFASHIASIMQKNTVQDQVALLERLSITDPLTELYNRRYLERRMEEETNRSMRNGSTLTIMMIDLDHFKTYNDLCGHVAGDRALEKVARVLCAAVRDMDVVTRYGGEEFCVLLPGTTKRESLFVANRIRRDIENELFPGEEKLPFGRLTTSIGISSFPGDGVTATAVINAADIALYEAKSAGRNRVMIFTGKATGERPQTSSPVTLIT